MLSVIIATRDCEHALVRTLAMLVSAAVAGVVRDVVVADAGSRDETGRIAEIAGCTLLVSDAPLATRLKEAAAATRGSWLLFLPPGCVLETGWGEEAARFVEDAELSGMADRAAVFRAQSSSPTGRSFIGQALTLAREALLRTPGPDQGLLISRKFYHKVGGHRPGGGDAQRDLLRRLSGRIVRLRSAIRLFDDDRR